ncbi:MAG: glucuronyl hydrolase [Lentisphaeria bacterium]|nr:glucuronyl hydrolase [Lentisphaeria bacterium]
MGIEASFADVAMQVWKRNRAECPMESYSSVLALHAMARLAKIVKSPELMAEIRQVLYPFYTGKVENAVGVYGRTVYCCGGNATAFLFHRGELPEARDILVRQAEKLIREQSRDKNGLFDMPSGNRRNHSRGFIWIDTVFGVCPFLLWTGLAAGRPDFVEEAVRQMTGHHEILFNPENRLYHQAFNAQEPDALTPAHWGRGHGWGVLALAELCYDLPPEHPAAPKLLAMYRDAMEGALAVQDGDGMWHQVLDDHTSYAESSCTGLILYAMGRGIKNGRLDEAHYRDSYLKGLRALSRCVAFDGSVFNCCVGCLAIGENSTAEEYKAHPWKLNDCHAFGPVEIAYGVAESLARSGRIPDYKTLVYGE